MRLCFLYIKWLEDDIKADNLRGRRSADPKGVTRRLVCSVFCSVPLVVLPLGLETPGLAPAQYVCFLSDLNPDLSGPASILLST